MKFSRKQQQGSKIGQIIFALFFFAMGIVVGIQYKNYDVNALLPSAAYYGLKQVDDVPPASSLSAASTIMSTSSSSSSSSTTGKEDGAAIVPFLVQRAGVSASGKWRLWHEMTPEQRNQSMVEVSEYVIKYGKLVSKDNRAMHDKRGCQPKVYGKTSGDHMLCNDPAPPQPCFFLSSGIHTDPSFDIALADDWKCRGLAFDPTVNHPSHLHPLVTFHNIGLNTVGANEEKDLNMGGEDWWYTSVTNAVKFFDIEYVDVLKLDCEGCELAFTRDIIAEDPTFLSRVSQFAVEVHVSKAWIKTDEQLYYFAIMFPLLEEAGFHLVSSKVNTCSKKHEDYGCRQELHDWGYLCGYTNRQKVTGSCHNFLFVRDDRRKAKK